MSTIKADNIATLAGVSTSMANAVKGSAKAWVNFNGTGIVAIRDSYNVSSITDNNIGNYTVNFTTAMPNANYAVAGLGSTGPANSGWGDMIIRDVDQIPTTTSVRVGHIGYNSWTDGNYACIVIFS